jgi:hypothetical protein
VHRRSDYNKSGPSITSRSKFIYSFLSSLALTGPSTDRSITRASSFFSRLTMLLPSHCHRLEPGVRDFPFVEICSVFPQPGRIINRALIDQGNILPVSRTLLQYHPPAPTLYHRAIVDLSATYQTAHSTIIIIEISLIDRNTIISISRALPQYHPTALTHILKAISDPTTDHDRAHNDGCDSLRGVLCRDSHGQVSSKTLGAAECRGWQQIQPLETAVPLRKVPHNRPACVAEVGVPGGISSQLTMNAT